MGTEKEEEETRGCTWIENLGVRDYATGSSTTASSDPRFGYPRLSFGAFVVERKEQTSLLMESRKRKQKREACPPGFNPTRATVFQWSPA